MKVLVAGDWHSELHEQAVLEALAALGHAPVAFAWHRYFPPASLLARLQNKYLAGPRVERLNRDLAGLARREQPALVFVYRGTHVTAATIRAIRAAVPGVTIVGYNNDDPFSPAQPRWLWRHFVRALPEYDAALAYRHHNLEDFRAHGARRVWLLRSWYMPARNRPVALDAADRERYGCDAVFVGHYEDDGRLALLEAVAQAGIRLRIFGPPWEWDAVLARSPALRALAPVRLVWGEDYNKALCGAKIALCFFSRLNRDTYTRRCFEIPATGTMMLCEHSEDMATLFTEGKDVEFFRDQAELVAKLKHYLADDALRARVAAAGRLRVGRDGHDATSRIRSLIEWLRGEGLLAGDAVARS